jgi:putative ATPase
MYQPLSEILRPQSIKDVIGQQHLIADGGPLSEMTQPRSLILWGPPGVGKTTLALLLANSWNCHVIKMSAVFSGIKEIREALAVAEAKQHELLNNNSVVIFIDEIHRFNKAQQDAFLHHLEDGSIVIIGATTENPSFELNNALLSRMHVYTLKPLSKSDLEVLLNRAQKNINLSFDDKAKELLLDMADGDARKLLNILEVLQEAKQQNINSDLLYKLIPNFFRKFDNGGDEFYNQISALHKSVRGSDPDAALYWFCRMLDGGADPLYLGRRILRIAWEDIGLADLNAQTIALNALNTYERLGSPEGELALASAIVYLAVTPKSNSTDIAFAQAKQMVATSGTHQVPLHLRNAPTRLMAEFNYGKEYKYAHDFNEHYVPNENYWPEAIGKSKFYQPSNQGLEQRVAARLDFLRALDAKHKK